MGISPDEFWGKPYDIYTGMTLREFDLFVQGYQKRLDADRELIAWHASCLMNCWVKKRVSPDDLLGKKRKQLSPEEIKIELSRRNKDKAENVIPKVDNSPQIDPDREEGEEDRWIKDLISTMS